MVYIGFQEISSIVFLFFCVWGRWAQCCLVPGQVFASFQYVYISVFNTFHGFRRVAGGASMQFGPEAGFYKVLLSFYGFQQISLICRFFGGRGASMQFGPKEGYIGFR